MENWMNICKNFTDENSLLTEGYYAEIASDEGIEARFLFGDDFEKNEEDIIKQAYKHIRDYMPEYDASEMDIHIVESVYRAYDKIFVNEGFDTNIERENSAREVEGFFARAYDSFYALEQGDFVDEFTLAVGYEIEDLSDEAFIKGAIEYLRPTLIHEKEQVNMREENVSENTVGRLRLKEQMDKMANYSFEYAVEITNNTGGLERQVDVFSDYDEAVRFANGINHDGETLANNECVRVIRIDYDNEGEEIDTEIMKVFERNEPDANKLFNDALKVVDCSIEPYKDENEGIEGYRIYDKEIGGYVSCDGKDVVVTDAVMAMGEFDTLLNDYFYHDLVDELEDYGLIKENEELPNTLFDLYVHTLLLANEELDGEGMKFWNAHEEELAMIDFICNRVNEVDLKIACSLPTVEQAKESDMTVERAEELFEMVLDDVHFSVEYSELAKGYVVFDEETKKYRGDDDVWIVDEEAIDNDAVEICHSATDVFEVLDTYICDSFINDMTDELERYGLLFRPDIPETIGDIWAVVQEWKDLPENTVSNKFYKDHEEEIAMMDLIVNHIDKVDLDKLYEVSPYCIVDIDKKLFVQMQGEKSDDYKLVNAEEATTFFSKSDVFNTSQMLNNTSKDCFVVLYDKPERAVDKLHIRDDAKKIAAENAEKKKRKSDYERD